MERLTPTRRNTIIAAIATLILIIGGGGYHIYKQNKTIAEITTQNELDKQMLEEEYNELSLQYEGYKFTISNDSLLAKLSSEQAKVQRLMEELRTVKSTNARRISELRRELETLRKVMRNYVIQIDSLNAANKELRDENKVVREQISKVSSERNALAQQKEQLSKRVELASKLVASSIRTTPLNHKGRNTKRISQIKQLQFDFTIDSNITASTGIKQVYMRITKPDDTLLTKSDGGTFSFEGGNVPYSIARQIEYGGEALPVTMYWNVDEYLSEGSYHIEIFADGYLIGRSSFILK